jgi:hypothetical protein
LDDMASKALCWATSRSGDDNGSSLIELMMAALIVGGWRQSPNPPYRAATGGQEDLSAQWSLSLTVRAAKLLHLESADYTTVTAGALAGTASLTYMDHSVVSTNPTEVSVYGSGAGTFVAASRSATGSCYAVRDSAASSTTFGRVSGPCNAANAATESGVPMADWVVNW